MRTKQKLLYYNILKMWMSIWCIFTCIWCEGWIHILKFTHSRMCNWLYTFFLWWTSITHSLLPYQYIVCLSFPSFLGHLWSLTGDNFSFLLIDHPHSSNCWTKSYWIITYYNYSGPSPYETFAIRNFRPTKHHYFFVLFNKLKGPGFESRPSRKFSYF